MCLTRTFHQYSESLRVSQPLWRRLGMLANSPLIWNLAVRSVPHWVDTLLLVSGVWMAVALYKKLLPAI